MGPHQHEAPLEFSLVFSNGAEKRNMLMQYDKSMILDTIPRGMYYNKEMDEYAIRSFPRPILGPELENLHKISSIKM